MFKQKNRKLFWRLSLTLSLGILGSFALKKTFSKTTHRPTLEIPQQMNHLKASVVASSNFTIGNGVGSQNKEKNCGVVDRVSTNGNFLNPKNNCWIDAELEEINRELDRVDSEFWRTREKFATMMSENHEIIKKALTKLDERKRPSGIKE